MDEKKFKLVEETAFRMTEGENTKELWKSFQDSIVFSAQKLEQEGFNAYEKFKQLLYLTVLGLPIGEGFLAQDMVEKFKSGETPIYVHLAPHVAAKSKIFTLDKNLAELFKNTKNEIKFREPPFPLIFINEILKPIDEIELYGICIKHCKLVDKIDSEDEALYILCIGRDFRDKSELYIYWTINSKGISDKIIHKKDFLLEKEINYIRNYISIFLCNILDFLNHPDIDVKVKEHPKEMNEHRISKGKLPIPSNHTISCKGKTLIYLNQTIQQMRNSPTKSFWVRSHYRHFRNKEIYKGIYKSEQDILKRKGYQIDNKGLISRLIFAHLKGKSKGKENVENKSYEVKI